MKSHFLTDMMACLVACAEGLSPGFNTAQMPNTPVEPTAIVQSIGTYQPPPIEMAYYELRQEDMRNNVNFRIASAQYHRLPVPTLVLK